MVKVQRADTPESWQCRRFQARASLIELTFEGETQFQVGTEIKHFIFGEGEILKLVQTTNAKNELGFGATIRFSNGDTKDIHLPMSKGKLEVIAL